MSTFSKILIFLFLSIGSHKPLTAKDSISVYIFLLDDCRICQEITPELNQIHQEYGYQFGFLGLFPNFSSKQKSIDAFAKKYSVQFPLKTDYFKKISKKMEATILPEVVVYNEDTEEVIYRGLINDQFYSVGKRRHKIENNYLRDCLDALKNNQKQKIKSTIPIGCFINFSDFNNN